MAKKQPLEVGQRLWVETVAQFYRDRERTIREYEVVRTNTSSAYIAAIEDLDKPEPYTIRVEQRTHKIVNRFSAGYSYTIWHSRQQFEDHVKLCQEIKDLREAAHEKVDKLRFSELREFVNGTTL